MHRIGSTVKIVDPASPYVGQMGTVQAAETRDGAAVYQVLVPGVVELTAPEASLVAAKRKRSR